MRARHLLLVLSCVSSVASADPITDGVNYLLSKQSADGTFGPTTQEEPLVATQEALAALNAVGLAGGAEAQSAQLGLAALAPAADTELELRRQVALVGSSFSLPFSTLTTNSAGFDFEDASTLSWSLLADRAQSSTFSATSLAKALRLTTFAQGDGCFSFVDDDTSADVTSVALMAMRPAQSHPTVAATRSAALTCLLSKQQPDGSFGSVSTTSLAVLALAESAGDQSAAIALGKGYLLATQSSGGWGSIRATSLAVRALAAAGAAGVTEPDWVVKQDASGAALLTVLNPNLSVGQALAVVVSVSNQSSVPAPAVPVRFRAVPAGGGASITIGQDTIPPLAPGASIDWDTTAGTTGLYGKYTVYADINPDHLVPEIDFTNNEAVGFFDVEGGVDLAVGSSSLAFTTLSASSVQVQASVINYGAATTAASVVNVYRGSPTTGSVIGSATIPAGFGTNSVFSFNFTWASTGLNGPTPVWIVADATNTIAETNEANNQSFRYYDPSSTGPVDLAVAAVSSPTTVAGQSFTIVATVQNLSTVDANDVPITLVYLGGRLTQTVIPFVPAGGSVSANLTGSVTYNPGQSSYFVDVVVDPDAQLSDPNRGNNKLTSTVTINSTGPAELSLSALTPAPASAQNGANVTLTVTAGNTGSAKVTTAIRLTDEVDGTVLGTIPVVLQANGSRTVALGDFPTPNRNMALRACVDPFNQYPELNKNDNCVEASVGQSAGAALVVTANDLRATPVGVDVGEAVTLSANVRNLGTADAGAVVEFWQGPPHQPNGVLLGQQPVAVAAGHSQTVSLPWVRAAGPAEFYANITRETSRESSSVVDPALGKSLQLSLFKAAGRHLFLEDIARFVNYPVGTSATPQLAISGRLLGNAAPELIASYLTNANVGGFEVLERQADAGYQQAWSVNLPNQIVCDLVAVDIEGDGFPEVVASTWERQSQQTTVHHLYAYTHFGQLRWQQTFPEAPGTGACTGGYTEMATGDWNLDGIVDFTFANQNLNVVSGDDGHVLAQLPINESLPSGVQATDSNVERFVDLNGDGQPEFFGSFGGQFLMFADGGQPWVATVTGRNVAVALPIVDTNQDGVPDAIRDGYPGLDELRLDTGAVEVSAASAAVLQSNAVGGLKQNGLRYPVGGASFSSQGAADRPDLTLLWEAPSPTISSGGVLTSAKASLADVLGLGRPQVIGSSCYFTPIFLDGRTGNQLLPYPAQLGGGGYCPLGYTVPPQAPVIADLAGDGTSRIAVPFEGDDQVGFDGYGPEYGNGEVLIFASAHWKKMPTAWPQRYYVKGRIGEDLKFNFNAPEAYRWWTTHNTFNDQFDVEPEHLLADFTVAAAAQGPATALQPFTLTATLNNVGGLSASNVPVRFYDGDPNDGGVTIGTATVAGPLAVLTGTAPASVSWPQPWPEGLHTIYVVANPDSAIQESGHEDNTASFRLLVHSATQFCDLSIAGSSLSASAAAPGQPQTYTATVSNVGTLGCPAVAMNVYDGPSGNAIFQGTASVPALAPATQVQVQVTADAIASTQLIRFIVDEAGVAQDPNLLNNEAALSLNNAVASKPDLRVAVLSANPAVPYPGESVALSATVLNEGTPSSPTDVTFSWGGQTVAGAVPSLAASGTATVTVTMVAPAAATTASATVDATHVVDEYDETNNTTTLAISEATPALGLAVVATPTTAPAGTTISAQVTLSDSAASSQLTQLTVDVLDATGFTATTLTSMTVAVSPAGVTLPVSWNTGTTSPGAYTLRARGVVNGRLEATATAGVTVLEGVSASAQLAAAHASYSPTDTVAFTARVSNTAHSATLAGATAVLSIIEPTTGNVLYTSSRGVPSLAPAGHFDFVDAFASSVAAKLGVYVARLDVLSSGVTVASVATSFTLVPSATKTVAITTTAGPVFSIGPALPVSVAVANHGSTGLTGSTVAVFLLESGGPTLTQLSMQSQSLTLSAGGSTTLSFSFPTAAVQSGPKLLVTQLDGTTFSTLVLEAVPVTDHEPPVIVITGVSDNQLTNQSVTPVITITDATAFTSSTLLDGQPFNSGTAVTAEGDHVLLVTATDVFNNSSAAMVRFSIDKTPPVLTLAGVADGAFSNAPLTLTYSATDAHPGSTSSTVDGAPFTSGDTVSSEGAHTWVVTSTDAAGNTSTQTVHFTLDFTPPAITVTGVSSGAYYRFAVVPVFSASDANLNAVTATLDGVGFASGSTVSSEGAHVLLVTATDLAGNTATTTTSFTLDFTPPVIVLGGVANGAYYAHAVTPAFSASDANLASVVATLDGLPFFSGATVSVAGSHGLVVTATDLAGNSASASLSFVLDFSTPLISVSGVTAGACYRQPVTPAINVSSPIPYTSAATLDGAPFTSGTPVSTAGQHTLAASATNAAGTTAQTSLPFTLDFTAPVISVTGVTNGAFYNHSVAPAFSASDASNTSVTATLDGVAFTSGSSVSTAGAHTLVVTATDCAGNTATTTVGFTLDLTAPTVTVTGVTDGSYYNHAVAPGFTAVDANLASATATLNGQTFISGTSVSTAGAYTLVVTAADKAGNTTTVTTHFTLDFTAPVITVNGVTNGASGSSFTITFSASDTSPVTTSATLDGVNFTSGTTVGTAGAHTLVVTATDAAGNTSSSTVSFTVTAQLTPPFHFGVCAQGNLVVENNAQVMAPSGQYDSVAANGSFTELNNASIFGDAVSGGNTVLKNNAYLQGTAYYGGNFTLQNNAHAGGHHPLSPAPLPCECGYDVASGLADAQASNNDSLLTGNPAYVNGALDVKSGTLTLAAGRYYFSSVRVRSNARLQTAAGAQVQLFVQGSVTVENNALLGASTSSPPLLVVSGANSNTCGGGTIDIRNNADAALLVYAPAADVTLANNATVVGAVVGHDVTLENNQKLKWSGPQTSPPLLTCP